MKPIVSASVLSETSFQDFPDSPLSLFNFFNVNEMFWLLNRISLIVFIFLDRMQTRYQIRVWMFYV